MSNKATPMDKVRAGMRYQDVVEKLIEQLGKNTQLQIQLYNATLKINEFSERERELVTQVNSLVERLAKHEPDASEDSDTTPENQG